MRFLQIVSVLYYKETELSVQVGASVMEDLLHCYTNDPFKDSDVCGWTESIASKFIPSILRDSGTLNTSYWFILFITVTYYCSVVKKDEIEPVF